MDFFENFDHHFIMAIQALSAMITTISIVQIVFVLVNVIILLLTIYMRPIKTRAEFARMLIYLFAAAAICSMTVWYYYQPTAEAL